MSVLVIASHLPGEGHFESDRYPVKPIRCVDDLSYWRGLAEEWDKSHVLINLEHDLEVSDELIAELLDCPEPLCSYAYACHWVTTGQANDVYAHLIGGGAYSGGRYVAEGAEWAHWSAIGFCKLSVRTGPLRETVWQRVEDAVNESVAPPWHLHWPEVPHHHW